MSALRSRLGLALIALACGCGDNVQIRVTLGQCDVSALGQMQSTSVVLRRDDGASWRPPCALAVTPITSLDGYVELLAGSFIFREVPAGGVWSVAVKGFSDDRCERALFCGQTNHFTLPPPSGEIVVKINCPPRYSEPDFKTCIRE